MKKNLHIQHFLPINCDFQTKARFHIQNRAFYQYIGNFTSVSCRQRRRYRQIIPHINTLFLNLYLILLVKGIVTKKTDIS